MRLTSSRIYTRAVPVPTMPPGLVVLMEGLTKDVLKNNPSNVYEFCANHLEKLLELRDGPSSKKSLTLEEKIAIAQEKVRQRAKERRQLFDKKVLLTDVEPGTPENMNEELMSNLRAPVHQDQELSLSSEVEISHEPTYNSLTSKDYNFDESDEIPISKSSTFSSVSKSTVIDLTVENDYENNSKEDVIKHIETSETEMKQEGEFNNKQKDKIIEISKRDVINNKVVNENETDDDQKDEIVVEKNIEQLTDNTSDRQSNIESLFSDNSHEELVKNESDSALNISVEDNHEDEVNNLIEVQPSITAKSSIENEHKLNEKNNAITEDEKHNTNQIELSQEVAENRPELNVEVASEPNICDEDSKTADNITIDSPNEIMSMNNADNEKSFYNQDNNSNADESQKISVQLAFDNSNAINNLIKSVDAHTIDLELEPNESSAQIEEVNDSIKMSEVETTNDKKISTLENNKKNNEFEDEKLQNTADEQLFSSKTNINDVANNDSEKLMKEEDNATSNSAALQITNSSENNDDSIIGSDLSKAEDDMHLSDNENNHNNMDLETAAVTIQKVFRSFLFKSRNSTFEDITNDEALEEDNDKNKEVYYATANINKERRPLGITRMDTVLQTVNEEKSLSLSTDDSSTLSSAATTIQAHVRGFLVRNKLNSYKTVSTNSLVNSNEMLDTDAEHQNNKTVLNIHIVPGESNYFSRDESLITSMELSLDGSPPSSVNLHPLSYDLVSERRKLLKREDAIQSVSPPSNNSGKLSEDSVKEVENFVSKTEDNTSEKEGQRNPENNSPETLITAVTDAVDVNETCEQKYTETTTDKRKKSTSSDESDVITPFAASPRSLVGDYENTTKLIHSGEFHDVVLPTNVSRSDTTVVREFKNVLVYILLWNNS